MNKKAENGVYFIDENYNILYVNSVLQEMYPEVKTGMRCYEAIACRNNKCNQCPLTDGTNQDTFFFPKRDEWFNAKAAEIELPAFGKCYSVTFSRKSDNKKYEEDNNSILPYGALLNQGNLEEKNKALQQQNNLMEFIIDGMPGGYHRCTAAEGYPITYASDKFLQMIGFSKSEIQEKFDGKFTNLVHPDDVAMLGEAVNSAIRTNSEISVHYRILTKNGYIQVVDTTRASELNGEKILQCVIVDISGKAKDGGQNEAADTMQKSLQEALVREQEYREQLNEMKNEILNSISCGVFSYYAETHELLNVNQEAKRMIGCSDDEDPIAAIRNFMLNNVVENDREKLSSTGNILQNPGDVVVNDYKAIVNGSTVCINSIAKLLEKADGQRYILITLTDTTELENRNTRLKNVLSMQKQMADSVGGGIFAYTLPEREVLIMNREAKRMFDCMGSDPANYGMDMVSKVIPEDMPAVREAVKKLTGPNTQTEYVFHCDSDEYGRMLFKCNTKLLAFENGQKYIISAITDITEQERIEKRTDHELQQYRNALVYGSKCFFTVDLETGTINQPIVDTNGLDLTKYFGIETPVDYDKIASSWFSVERIFSAESKINHIRSKKDLLECYNEGNSILDTEYHVPESGKYYHIMVLLYKIDEHVQASFIIYDITDKNQGDDQQRPVTDSPI